MTPRGTSLESIFLSAVEGAALGGEPETREAGEEGLQ